MARAFFSDVAIRVDGSGDAFALDLIQVTVTARGGGTVQIYNDATTGSAKANPFLTDATGDISFWAAFGSYDVAIEDSRPTPLIAARTVGWDAVPYADLFDLLPAGTIAPTARRSAPVGWLLCDGSAVSRTTYSRLWDALRTDSNGNLTSSSPFGNGNGSTTFNLPDMRGKMIAGVDAGANNITTNNTIGASGGLEQVGLTEAQLPVAGNHSHSFGGMQLLGVNTSVYPGVFAEIDGTSSGWFGHNPTSDTGSPANDVHVPVFRFTSNRDGWQVNNFLDLSPTNTGFDGTFGNNEPHQNLPPYIVTNHMIKT